MLTSNCMESVKLFFMNLINLSKKTLKSIISILQLICVVFFLKYTYNNFSDRAFLIKQTQKIFEKEIVEIKKISEEKRVRIIMRYIKKTLSFEGVNKTAKRPFLRATAVETLKSKKGLCGEFSRVGILLLHFAGIEAQRFYLFGPKWEHVLLNCKIDGKWYLIDNFNEPSVEMKETDIKKVEFPKFELLRNDWSALNPWTDYQSVRFFHNYSFLRNYRAIIFPHTLVIFFASPYLIKSVFFVVLFLTLTFLRLKKIK